MAKTGRPTLNDDTARGRHVAVRLSPLEHAALVERATAAGLSVSDYIRAALQVQPVAPRRRSTGEGVFSSDDRAALLNIGNNLNQAVRVMHGDRVFSGAADVRAAAKKLDAVLDRYLPK